jgi:flavin reductase (DIM6/NTAB) family NADH-FMN oxidoreductase RutF
VTRVLDPALFRRALGRFPTGVAVITTSTHGGRRLGLTANSFTSVSLEPPLVSWSLRRRSRLFDAFRRGGHFAVNVLATAQADLAARFAGQTEDRFAGLDVQPGLGEVPLLAGCVAYFECATAGCHLEGDHAILIGRVERFSTGAHDERPLVFCEGAYMSPAERKIAA